MAKKKKKSRSANNLKSVVAFLKDDRFRFAVGIIFLLGAIFMLLSFISYLINWKTDQDFEWAKVFSGPEISVKNQGGKLGAWMSDLFINRWFGVASFLFPGILLLWALSLYKIRLVKTWKAVRNSLLLIILLSVTFGFLFGDANGMLGSGPGGQHGFFLSRWLVATLGYYGTSFLLLICFVALILFSTRFLNWLSTNKNLFKRLFPGKVTDDLAPEDIAVDDLHEVAVAGAGGIDAVLRPRYGEAAEGDVVGVAQLKGVGS